MIRRAILRHFGVCFAAIGFKMPLAFAAFSQPESVDAFLNDLSVSKTFTGPVKVKVSCAFKSRESCENYFVHRNKWQNVDALNRTLADLADSRSLIDISADSDYRTFASSTFTFAESKTAAAGYRKLASTVHAGMVPSEFDFYIEFQTSKGTVKYESL